MSRLVNYTCSVHGNFVHRVTCGHGSGPAPEHVRCHVAGCDISAKRARQKKDRPWRTVQINMSTYVRLKAYCEAQDVTLASVVDACTQDLGGAK